jgi:hypothetical protein
MTTEHEAYRIMQDGMVVARTEGQHSLREIMHYATVYSQDGPLKIQKRTNKRWKVFGQVTKPQETADAE